MTAAILSLVTLALFLVAAVVLALWVARQRGLPKLVSQTVVLHTVDGRSLRGVLTHEYRDVVILNHVVYLNEGGETEVSGEVVVPRPQVAFMQVGVTT
jgi:hypothetical protein